MHAGSRCFKHDFIKRGHIPAVVGQVGTILPGSSRARSSSGRSDDQIWRTRPWKPSCRHWFLRWQGIDEKGASVIMSLGSWGLSRNGVKRKTCNRITHCRLQFYRLIERCREQANACPFLAKQCKNVQNTSSLIILRTSRRYWDVSNLLSKILPRLARSLGRRKRIYTQNKTMQICLNVLCNLRSGFSALDNWEQSADTGRPALSKNLIKHVRWCSLNTAWQHIEQVSGPFGVRDFLRS